jgi:hypothetical protein
LVLVLASLLNTGGDGADELGLLAVALEVEELGATITAEGADEAAQLEGSVSKDMIGTKDECAYRAGGDIGKLGAGKAGSNQGNQSGGELHLDGIVEKIKDIINGVPEKTVKCI